MLAPPWIRPFADLTEKTIVAFLFHSLKILSLEKFST